MSELDVKYYVNKLLQQSKTKFQNRHLKIYSTN